MLIRSTSQAVMPCGAKNSTTCCSVA